MLRKQLQFNRFFPGARRVGNAALRQQSGIVGLRSEHLVTGLSGRRAVSTEVHNFRSLLSGPSPRAATEKN